MAIRWQVKFRSLRTNTLYTANVYDASYSGEPVQLKGAADAFVTEEDTSDDMFLPVRTQTGYLSIVDYTPGFDWTALIPQTATSRPVTLTDSTGTLWVGFLQPQTFSGDLYGNPQERRFPVCDVLSVLASYDVAPGRVTDANFAYIIDYIFSLPLSGLSPRLIEDFWFGGGRGVISWLQKRANWELFRTYDSDDVARSKYNGLELLEEICKFWGWTVRQHGTSIYFSCADADAYPDWVVYLEEDLYNAGTGGSYQTADSAYSSLALSGDEFAGVNNQEFILPGRKKAVVRAKINKFDEVMSVDLDAFTHYLDKYGANIAHQQVATDLHWFERGDSLSMAEVVAQGEGLIRLDCGNCWLEIDVDMDGQPWEAYGTLFEYFVFREDLQYLHDLNFTPVLKIVRNNDYPYMSCARVKSKRAVNLDDGVLVISGSTEFVTIHDGAIQTWNAHGTLTCRLKVGNSYWNGSSWTTTASEFTMTIGDWELKEGEGSIPSNRTIDQNTWTSPYPNYNGFGVPVSGVLAGIVEFNILNVTTAHTAGGSMYGEAWFKNLKIDFLRSISASARRDVSENEYTGATQSIFAGDVDVSTIFATDNNNAAGYGIIMNPDGSYCSQVDIYQSGGQFTDHIEQYVADRIASYGSTLRRKVSGEYRMDAVGEVTPHHLLTLEGKSYYPASISHEWREDKVNITMLEV